MNNYDTQANNFLDRFGFRLQIHMTGGKCPIWGHAHGCQHGDHYRVTIRRLADKRSLSFDWWGSQSMMWNHQEPKSYDVLSNISNNALCSTNPDEVAQEFDGIPPTQAIAIAKFARRLQGFFTLDELGALATIC